MRRILLIPLFGVSLLGCGKKPPAPAASNPPSPAPVVLSGPTTTQSTQDNSRAPKMNARNVQDRLKAENELHQIGLAYRNCLTSENRPPQTPDDLAPYIENLFVSKIKDGTYVVFMGVKEPPAGAILGYMEGTPTNGGVVLFGDGSVRNINVAEFQSTPKAK